MMARNRIILVISTALLSLLLLLLLVYHQDELFNHHQIRSLETSTNGSLFYPELKNEGVAKDISPLSNKDFSYTFSYLKIDATDELNLTKYSCRPTNFGLSVAEGSLLFPSYHYPKCSDVTGVRESKLRIDRKSNSLFLNCKPPLTGYYFSGPIKNQTLMRKENTVEFKLNKYERIVEARNISFAVGLCSSITDLDKKPGHYGTFQRYDIDSEDFQHGDMKPIFDRNMFNEKKNFVEGKPRIIFMLTLDSISRRHFYRKLPKLVNFLNESTKEIPHMAVFDFKMHSTFGSDSVHNQVPIFSGKPVTKARGRTRNSDVLDNKSMWHELKKQGYLTIMGFDDCDSWFPDVLGENLKVDISIRQFYCLLDVYGDIKSEKLNTEQRCFGAYQTHTYMLKYTLELISQYQGLNMWIYLHLNAGHEKTGQHANTLDNDLTIFLKDFFQTTKGRSESFIFLGADHGMRYGNWHKSVEAYQETLLPSMFVIAEKSLLNRYSSSYHCLSENSRRLTSKLDIRKTIFALSKISTKVNNAVNWVEEIASYSRDCKDLKSNVLFCACSKMKEIKDFNNTVREVLEVIKERIEINLNNLTYRFPGVPIGRFCDEVILDVFLKFYHVNIDDSSEIFKLEFGNSLFEDFRVQANVAVSFSLSNLDSYSSDFEPFEILVEDSLHYAKIVYVARMDKYSGKCQKIAEEFGIAPEFCLRRKC